MTTMPLGLNFIISKNERWYLFITGEKRVDLVMSVVKVLSPKPVETNTYLVRVEVHRKRKSQRE